MYEFFQSIEDVWIIWVIALLAFAWFLRRPLKQFRRENIKRFATSEAGASYALPYVLTFPLFLLLMAMLIQATFIIMVKVGTVYAAHSAARTYIVWQGMKGSFDVGGDDANFRISYQTHRAAMMAMAPFANSGVSQRRSLFPLYPLAFRDNLSIEKGGLNLSVTLANLLSGLDSTFYGQAYDRLLNDANSKDKGYTHPIINDRNMKASRNYIKAKYAYAAAATRVSRVLGSGNDEQAVDIGNNNANTIVPWNGDVKLKLKYRMGFHIPGTARIFLGSWRPWSSHRFRDIETTVTLPSEAAANASGTIGIPYKVFLF